MKIKRITPEEAEHFYSITVPVVYGRLLLFTPDEEHQDPYQMAVFGLDASQRPDVADLARVTRAEGLPPTGKNPPIVYLSEPEPGILHHFKFNNPVKCEYALFLSYEKHPGLFPVMVAISNYYTTTGLAKDVVKEGLGVSLNGPELEKVISEYWS